LAFWCDSTRAASAVATVYSFGRNEHFQEHR
jgi:hypothetical protein